MGKTWGVSVRRGQQTINLISHPRSYFMNDKSKRRSQNYPFIYPELLSFESFAQKKAQQPLSNPALLIQGAAARFCGIFECVTCKFLHLSGKRCTFFSYHKLKVFSPLIEAEGFSCFVTLTRLPGEEKVHLMFQVDVQEKSEKPNKWKLKQLSLSLSAVKVTRLFVPLFKSSCLHPSSAAAGTPTYWVLPVTNPAPSHGGRKQVYGGSLHPVPLSAAILPGLVHF